MEKFKLTGQGVIAGKAYKAKLDRLSFYMKYVPNKILRDKANN